MHVSFPCRIIPGFTFTLEQWWGTSSLWTMYDIQTFQSDPAEATTDRTQNPIQLMQANFEVNYVWPANDIANIEMVLGRKNESLSLTNLEHNTIPLTHFYLLLISVIQACINLPFFYFSQPQSLHTIGLCVSYSRCLEFYV